MIEDDEVEFYPLRLGETLTSSDWVEVRYHRLLGSRWRAVMAARSPDAGFFGFILWFESLRQDPAGTLPDDELELAQLAGLGGDPERWRALRGCGAGEGALYGWRPCLVETAGPEPIRRLWHRTILDVVQQTLSRTRGRQAASAAGGRRVRLSRIRRHLPATGLSRKAVESDVMVEAVDAWLASRTLSITAANVRQAVEEVSKGNVVQLPDLNGK